NVQIDPGVNLEELQKTAHALGEVVGLGLRNLANCPIELNLMPESTLRWQTFNQKKPYIIMTVLSLVMVVGATGWLYSKLASVKSQEYDDIHPKVEAHQRKAEQFKKAYSQELKQATKDMQQVSTWLEDRYYWADVTVELRRILIEVERNTRAKLNTDTGVWIEQMTTKPSLGSSVDTGFGPTGLQPGMVPGMMGRTEFLGFPGRRPMGVEEGAPAPAPNPNLEGMPMPAPEGSAPMAAPSAAENTNEVSKIALVCRAVDVANQAARQEIPFELHKQLVQSSMFNPSNTVLSAEVTPDATGTTFTFGVTLGLKRPMKN
ncbi:MAG: hypothetical protein RLY20_2918, partial [Verrucomicrobiota bacterium]